MIKKFLYPTSILIILIIAACRSTPEPTLTFDDIRNTAVAEAWIAMTLTQAGIPTATQTPIPPSPSPSPTLNMFPTLPPIVSTVATPTATAGACNQVPPIEPKGAQVQVQFVNKSEGSVNLSFGMNSPNDQKECVTYSYALGRFDEPVVTVLAGCYWAYGWVEGDIPSTAQTIDLLCVTDPNKVPPIWIGTEVIAFH